MDAGDLSLAVSYRGFPIYTESKDLCEQTDCPVKKGPVKVDLEQPFPIITPPVRLPANSTFAVRESCKVNIEIVLLLLEPSLHLLWQGPESETMWAAFARTVLQTAAPA